MNLGETRTHLDSEIQCPLKDYTYMTRYTSNSGSSSNGVQNSIFMFLLQIFDAEDIIVNGSDQPYYLWTFVVISLHHFNEKLTRFGRNVSYFEKKLILMWQNLLLFLCLPVVNKILLILHIGHIWYRNQVHPFSFDQLFTQKNVLNKLKNHSNFP